MFLYFLLPIILSAWVSSQEYIPSASMNAQRRKLGYPKSFKQPKLKRPTTGLSLPSPPSDKSLKTDYVSTFLYAGSPTKVNLNIVKQFFDPKITYGSNKIHESFLNVKSGGNANIAKLGAYQTLPVKSIGNTRNKQIWNPQYVFQRNRIKQFSNDKIGKRRKADGKLYRSQFTNSFIMRSQHQLQKNNLKGTAQNNAYQQRLLIQKMHGRNVNGNRIQNKGMHGGKQQWVNNNQNPSVKYPSVRNQNQIYLNSNPNKPYETQIVSNSVKQNMNLKSTDQSSYVQSKTSKSADQPSYAQSRSTKSADQSLSYVHSNTTKSADQPSYNQSKSTLADQSIADTKVKTTKSGNQSPSDTQSKSEETESADQSSNDVESNATESADESPSEVQPTTAESADESPIDVQPTTAESADESPIDVQPITTESANKSPNDVQSNTKVSVDKSSNDVLSKTSSLLGGNDVVATKLSAAYRNKGNAIKVRLQKDGKKTVSGKDNKTQYRLKTDSLRQKQQLRQSFNSDHTYNIRRYNEISQAQKDLQMFWLLNSLFDLDD